MKKQENSRDLVVDFKKYLVELHRDGVDYLPAGEEPAPAESVGVSLLASLRELKRRGEGLSGCRKCSLASGRENVVFGEGGFRKKVMLIGEGPGETEDRQGRPFVGRAGRLLDKILMSIGLTREDVYITNIVKCRPPGNRDPRPDEILACWAHLEDQIEALRPRAIVSLGSPATRTLLESRKGISQLRERVHDYQGIPLIATYHPAYLLRSYTVENRRRVWEDVKRLQKLLQEEDPPEE